MHIRSTTLPAAVCGACLLALAGALVWLVGNIGLNMDEGFYGMAAREVWRGHMPYRDFGFTQGPVFPFAAGAILHLTGHGIAELRAFCAACALGSVVLAAGFLWRRGLQHGAAVLFLVMLGAAGWLCYSATVKTYALAGLLLTATYLAYLAEWSWLRRLWWVTIAGVLAIGCRVPVAPAVGLLWIALFFEASNHRDRLIGVVLPAICLGMVFGPFAFADRTAFTFWSWTFHFHSLTQHTSASRLGSFAAMAPVVWLLVLTAIVLAFRPSDAPSPRVRWLLAASCAGIGFNIASSQTYGEYCVPLAVPSALTAILVLHRKFTLSPCRAIVATSTFAALSFSLIRLAPAGMPMVDQKMMPDLRNAANELHRAVGGDGLVLTGMPCVPYEAGFSVPLNMLMGNFAVTCEYDQPTAARFGLVTLPMLWDAVQSGKADAIVLYFADVNFLWSMPSIQPIPQASRERIFDAIGAHYELFAANDHFRIYTRRTKAS